MYRPTENTKTDMNVEFNEEFRIGKKFASAEQMKATVKKFGKKHNIVFSISKSTPSKGQYVYICKHGGYKRDRIDDKSIEKKYKKSTQKFGCPAYIKVYNLTVTENQFKHNHEVQQDPTIYAIYRKQEPEVMDTIFKILSSSHKDSVGSVMATLNAMGINNVIKKDIQNIQALFLKDDNGKEMYSLITNLESLNYIVRIQVKSHDDKFINGTGVKEVTSLFFIKQSAIEDARRWPEAVTIDATYKTNAHKMSLINIVGTSNASSVRVDNRLETYPLAAAFVSSEKEEFYTWVLQELRNAIWRDDDTLPSVFVTDNEQALRNAIESVFPESNHLLCTWHLWNTMATKLAVGNTTKEEYNLRLAEAELAFKSAMTCSEESAFQRSLIKFQTIISAPGRFAKNGETAKLYLKNVLLQDDEVKRWAGVHANKHSHMGNRTSGRAEGYHAGLKKALGHQSASRLTLTTKRMDAYYDQKRAERNRRLRIDSLSYDSLLFNKGREYRFVNLRHKVVRFAMDRIILNTIKTTQEGFESKGEGCSCSDRVVYKLPCPCIIDSTSDIIPLTIVDKRWYIELEHGYSLSNRAFTVQRKITEKIINSDVDDTANFSGNSFKSISLDDNADEINEVEEEVEGEEKEGEEEEDVEEEDVEKENEAEEVEEEKEVEEEVEEEDVEEEDVEEEDVEEEDVEEEEENEEAVEEEVEKKQGTIINFGCPKAKFLTDIEATLHRIYIAAKKYTTQQELSDALTVLKQAEEKIVNPEINMNLLLAPSTNLNRKGRKSNKRGVKSGTERLQILKELHDKKQKEIIKKREKEAKKEEEISSQKRLLEIEERHVALELKKRKITLIHRDSDGTFPQLDAKTISAKNAENSTMISESTIDKKLIIYSNPKKDSVFNFVEINPKSVLSKIYSVSGDGNCGFRAVSLTVYNHQENWIKVKQDMLATYQKYQDSLYKPEASTQTLADFERTKMLKKLTSTISPCYDSNLWFSTFTCPQVVADTYNRPVVVFTYREFYVEKDRKMKEFKDAFSFFPLVEMNIIENINNPILLLLAQSHFYLIELKKTPKGKLKKYKKIPLNTDHQRIRKTYPQQCNSVDFSMMW